MEVLSGAGITLDPEHVTDLMQFSSQVSQLAQVSLLKQSTSNVLSEGRVKAPSLQHPTPNTVRYDTRYQGTHVPSKTCAVCQNIQYRYLMVYILHQCHMTYG